MGLKDILLHHDTTEQASARLDVAVELARRHQAHLTALHVIDVALPVNIAAASHGGAAVMAHWIEEQRTEILAAADQLRQDFLARLDREGIAGEWRQPEGPVAETVALHARYADLAIIGQKNPDLASPGRYDVSRVPEQVLFSSGRPLLVVPYAGHFGTVGRNVLVGWNASREAARAVNDALPLIAAAERTTVLAINPSRGIRDDGGEPAADIALHLARHGRNVTAAHTVADGIGEGDVLLNYAADIGADLLVMGGYGHARVRELIMGGATRSILDHATIPVLLSR